jgi:hypothetical protein
MTARFLYTFAMQLTFLFLSVQFWGFFWLFILFFACFLLVHVLRVFLWGIAFQKQSKTPPPRKKEEEIAAAKDEKQPSSAKREEEPQPVYYIVERKRRSKCSYTPPKQINFK